ALVVEHVTGDVGGEIGLVEMIGCDDLDLAPEHFTAEVFCRHLRRFQAARTGDVGVKARHVEDPADLERRLVFCLGRGDGECQQRAGCGEYNSLHSVLPMGMPHAAAASFVDWTRSCRMACSAASARRGTARAAYAWLPRLSAKRNGRHCGGVPFSSCG